MRPKLQHFTGKFLLSLLLIGGAATVEARPLERVPQDGSLQQAIQRVSDRGVIEIADGVYPAPDGGFTINSPGKSFTLRAVAGATVVLDGQGTDPILVYDGDGAASGRRVSFERLTFRNGFSSSAIRGGAVTVANGHAVFVSSTFEDNANVESQSRGGGAVQVREQSRVRFTNCVFTGNTALLRGGAVYVSESRVSVLWSRFTDNRTNVPGHNPVSAGGALFALDFDPPADTELEIQNSRFVGNEAGSIGGAINAFGMWSEPLSTPAARVTVVNSTFAGNRAMPDPCCAGGGPTLGGVAHVEDHVTLEIRNSRLDENVAMQGGALSSYRARIEVHDSMMRGNRAEVVAGQNAVGGTIVMTSADFNDPSTGFGTINRRNAELVMTGSLVQGRFGSTTIGGRQGGCLFANGDVNFMDGTGGVPQNGTEEVNRAPVLLSGVTFFDCDVERTASGAGRGGAIMTILADLTMEDSLISNSDALGAGGTGGGINAFDRSALHLRGTAFAHNAAEQRGGAILASGGSVEIDNGFFLENDVTPATAPGSAGEQIQNATGAALSMTPNLVLGRDITGTVESSLFVGNVGIPIEDLDRVAGPFNRVRYSANDFQTTAFGAAVFKNSLAGVGLGGLTAGELNGLVIARTGAPATDKSDGGNRRLASAPPFGRVVAVPSEILSVGAAGDRPIGFPQAPTSVFLGHAWSGNAATLAGRALPQKSGLVEVSAAGSYPLRANGQVVATAAVGEGTCDDGRLLCLRRERFLIEVDWRDFVGNVGDALVAPVGTDDSGLFFFFDADNWEILAKVLNGCGFNQHFWLFSAATTNVEYTLRVTDTVSGLTKSFFNPLGAAAAAVTDTTALAACGFMPAAPELDPSTLLAEIRSLVEDPRLRAESGESLFQQGNCMPSATNLCLNNDRFRIEVEWRDFTGNTGSGEVVPFGTDDSGLFFFFDPNNIEMLVKVLNGCGFNQHYWVFAAATTNVQYTLRATDTDRGNVVEFFNPLGNAAPAITDTGAFPTCP